METKITLSEKIKNLRINNVKIPDGVKSFTVSSDSPLNFACADEYGKERFGVMDYRNGQISGEILSARTDDGIIAFLSNFCGEDAEVVKRVRSFGFESEITLLTERGNRRVVIENATQFIAVKAFGDVAVEEQHNAVLIKDEKNLTIIGYDKDYYKAAILPCDNYKTVNGQIVAVKEFASNEGIICRYTAELGKPLGKYVKTTEFLRKGNYTEKTFAAAFLERLKYCEDEKVAEMLSEDLSEDVAAIREYLGEYEDFTLLDGYAVLVSEKPKSVRFSISDGKIDNVSEL